MPPSKLEAFLVTVSIIGFVLFVFSMMYGCQIKDTLAKSEVHSGFYDYQKFIEANRE